MFLNYLVLDLALKKLNVVLAVGEWFYYLVQNECCICIQSVNTPVPHSRPRGHCPMLAPQATYECVRAPLCLNAFCVLVVSIMFNKLVFVFG